MGGRSMDCTKKVSEQGDLETTLPWPVATPMGGFSGGDEVSEIENRLE